MARRSRCGEAWLVLVRQGEAVEVRLGTAGRGGAGRSRRGLAWFGTVRRG